MKTPYKLFLLYIVFVGYTNSYLPLIDEHININLRENISEYNKDCILDISYSNTIKTIIEKTCVVDQCHSSDSSMKGDFSSYEGIIEYVNGSSLFEERILINKDMPPSYSPGPIQLSSDQIKKIECWIEQGYIK